MLEISWQCRYKVLLFSTVPCFYRGKSISFYRISGVYAFASRCQVFQRSNENGFRNLPPFEGTKVGLFAALGVTLGFAYSLVERVMF